MEQGLSGLRADGNLTIYSLQNTRPPHDADGRGAGFLTHPLRRARGNWQFHFRILAGGGIIFASAPKRRRKVCKNPPQVWLFLRIQACDARGVVLKLSNLLPGRFHRVSQNIALRQPSDPWPGPIKPTNRPLLPLVNVHQRPHRPQRTRPAQALQRPRPVLARRTEPCPFRLGLGLWPIGSWELVRRGRNVCRRPPQDPTRPPLSIPFSPSNQGQLPSPFATKRAPPPNTPSRLSGRW